MVQEEGLHVYNVRNIIEEHFSISIVAKRSRGGSLVAYKVDKAVQILYDLNVQIKSRWTERGVWTT
jgi:hypothetical protein